MKYYILFIFLFPLTLFAQTDYYVKDSVLNGGVDILSGSDINNALSCKIKTENGIKELSPTEINEYSVNNRVYKSYKINTKDSSNFYFLEQIVTGNVSLYYLKINSFKNRYFIVQKDQNNIIELDHSYNKNAEKIIQLTTDCPDAINHLPHFYAFYTIKKYIKEYNNCNNTIHARTRFGISLGVNNNNLSSLKYNNVSYTTKSKNHQSFSIHALIDIPISNTNFSFHPELYLKKNSFYTQFQNGSNSKNLDIIINNFAINIPLLLRFNQFIKGNRIFFETGPMISYSIKNKGKIYDYTIENDIYINEVQNKSLIKNKLYGFSFGLGFIKKYTSPISLFSELRFSTMNNFNNSQNSYINFNELSLNIGLLY